MTGRSKDSRQRARPRGVPLRSPAMHQATAKNAGALVCTSCDVVCHRGQWYCGKPPVGHVELGTCPACRRVRDNYPAGVLKVPPAILERKQDVIGMVRNVEAVEKAEHPLERLMAIETKDGALIVSTTGVHLAREIAHKLGKQLHCKPRFDYSDNEELVRVEFDAPERGPSREGKR